MDFQLSPEGIRKALKEIFDNHAITPYFQFRFFKGSFEAFTAGPIWLTIDTEKKTWSAESNERNYVSNRETKISGEYESLYDIRDLLAMFSDEYAHDRLKAMAYVKHGKRSFT